MAITTFRKLAGAAVAAVPLALAAPAQAAPFTYEYTGSPFTSFPAPSDLTTSDFIHGTFTVELPSNIDAPLANYVDSVVAFSFSAGALTVTELDDVLLAIFFLATDGDGDIVDWSIQLTTPDAQILTILQAPTVVSDIVRLLQQNSAAGFDPGGLASSHGDTGAARGAAAPAGAGGVGRASRAQHRAVLGLGSRGRHVERRPSRRDARAARAGPRA